MSLIKEEMKCLASLAVFRELYNSRQDIYSVIDEFIKEIISSNNKYQFSLTEITNLLNQTYDFSIPEAVVSTSLNRFGKSISKSNGLYTIIKEDEFRATSDLSNKYLEIQNNTKSIINKLIRFIEEKKGNTLTSIEKEELIRSFSSFIMESATNQLYSEYISAFILSENGDRSFISCLNTIKEGVILYTGLQYNSSLNEFGLWKTDLTIFLDTEMLFHLAGYNGVLYQNLFNDFHSLVKEINDKSIKKYKKILIKLKYFSDIKSEIEKFFKKAENIISGKEKANPAKTAMTTIINGCKSPADVIQKKVMFYELLKDNCISEDVYTDYYSENNRKYNIEDQNIINSISQRNSIEDVQLHLKYLNFINILRKGNSNKNFENIEFIFLTGTRNVIIISLDEAIRSNNEVPLACDLNFITNKFWFKLNKGFGQNDYPKTFNIITKAQIVLSSLVNNSVSEKFDELVVKYKEGELTEEQASATIGELRRQAKKPEDINETALTDVLNSINEDNIEHIINEKDYLKCKTIEQEQENVNLKKKLEQLEKEKKLKEYEAEEKEKELQKYKKIEEEKRKLKNKWIKLAKQILLIFLFIIFIIIEVLLYVKFKWIKLAKQILLIFLFIIFIIIGVLLYVKFKRLVIKIIGLILALLSLISAILSILSFFGFNFEQIKKHFFKSRRL